MQLIVGLYRLLHFVKCKNIITYVHAYILPAVFLETTEEGATAPSQPPKSTTAGTDLKKVF